MLVINRFLYSITLISCANVQRSTGCFKDNFDNLILYSDIRSTGCVVLEMVQGKRPWAELESNYQIMFKVVNFEQLLFFDRLDIWHWKLGLTMPWEIKYGIGNKG